MRASAGRDINRRGIDMNGRNFATTAIQPFGMPIRDEERLERKMEELKKELTTEMARISRQIQELTRDLRSLNAKMISIQEGGRYF